jgi:hypothetical protein
LSAALLRRSLRRCRGARRPATAQAGAVALAALGLLSACSPALDWRQVRPEGWGLVASWPCRPDVHSRRVVLAGPAVVLELQACRADGHMFALASADMADPARVGPALRALGEAARANVQGRVEAERPAAVPGMTPNAGALWWQLQGRLPDGGPVREQVLVFAHGLRVFQATVVGPSTGEAQAKPFFDTIALPQ